LGAVVPNSGRNSARIQVLADVVRVNAFDSETHEAYAMRTGGGSQNANIRYVGNAGKQVSTQ
jgi:hypothetical protein